MGAKVLCKIRKETFSRLLAFKRNQGTSEMLVGTNYYCELIHALLCVLLATFFCGHQVPTEVLYFHASFYDADISVIESRHRMCFEG